MTGTCQADRRWAIDVCRTCGRQATWPFCEHRDIPAPPGGVSWCVPVAVKPCFPGQVEKLLGA